MLKEINIEELNDYDPENVIVLHDEAVYTLDEFRPIARFLVDEDEDELEDDEEIDPEEEDDDDSDPEEDEQPTRRRRRSQEEIIELIKNAQAHNCVTIPEIMDYTGIRYDTVKKYLIMLEEKDNDN